MRWSVLPCLYVILVPALAGQDSLPATDTAVVAPVPTPPPPTPAQSRYLNGLRTAGRGVAQLKDGVDRVMRSSQDTLRLRRAGSRLAGLCGAARGFMANGRAQMQPSAYEDSTRLRARVLAIQIDSLIRYIPTCEARAAHQPDRTAGELFDRLRAYETVLRDFRTAIGLPNRTDTPLKD